MIVRLLDQAFDITTLHELRHEVGLTVFFTDIMHTDDMRVVT